MLNEVLHQIERRETFVLTSHARADGDAVGSTLACGEILRRMGKQAEIVLRDGVPRVYQQLPFAPSVIQAERVNGNYDAAIILECDSIQRTRLEGLEGRFLINIDHHKSGRAFADVNWIDPKAVATAELVYRLARDAGVKILKAQISIRLNSRGSWCWRAPIRLAARGIFTSGIPRPSCVCWARRFPRCNAKVRWPGFG